MGGLGVTQRPAASVEPMGSSVPAMSGLLAGGYPAEGPRCARGPSEGRSCRAVYSKGGCPGFSSALTIHMSMDSSRIVIVGLPVTHGSQIIAAMQAAAKIKLSVSRVSQKNRVLLTHRSFQSFVLKSETS